MKIAFRIFALLLAAITASSVFTGFKSNDSFSGVIFSISGIIFSLGISLITAFDYSSVKNKYYITHIRAILSRVRCWFILFFAVTLLCYILEYYFRSQDIVSSTLFNIRSFPIELNYSILLYSAIFYSIFYYFANFKRLQDLRDEIFDKVLEEEEKNKKETI